jgi:hypothetical protein
MQEQASVTLILSRVEAIALEQAADTGVRVSEALNPANRTIATDTALARLRAAISGSS